MLDAGGLKNGCRAIFDYVVANRSVADANITLAGKPEA
jgi:hypothetical protein